MKAIHEVLPVLKMLDTSYQRHFSKPLGVGFCPSYIEHASDPTRLAWVHAEEFLRMPPRGRTGAWARSSGPSHSKDCPCSGTGPHLLCSAPRAVHHPTLSTPSKAHSQ